MTPTFYVQRYDYTIILQSKLKAMKVISNHNKHEQTEEYINRCLVRNIKYLFI